MKLPFVCKALVPSVVLSLGLLPSAFAQSDNGTTVNNSVNAAGQSMRQARSGVADTAKDAYQQALTSVGDSEITAKVKNALHEEHVTDRSNIQVSTFDGIVTLRGKVPTLDIAMRAMQAAQAAKGVKQVNNELKIWTTIIAD
ncbi:MAG: BON domain-containing protein [Deltaproteobacteria bacterium]|nr:BON domain-containing protein [Deltaproteobacteria bacterium]